MHRFIESIPSPFWAAFLALLTLGASWLADAAGANPIAAGLATFIVAVLVPVLKLLRPDPPAAAGHNRAGHDIYKQADPPATKTLFQRLFW